MLSEQKRLLTLTLDRAEACLKTDDNPNWFLAHHVIMRLAGIMLSWMPDATVAFYKEADECLPGEKDAGKKFITVSRNYIQTCRDWLESQEIKQELTS